MKIRLTIGLGVLLLVAAACGSQSDAVPSPTSAATSAASPAASSGNSAAANANVSFASDVLPILKASCNKCHGIEQIKKGLDMRTYSALMTGSFNGVVVKPGNSAGSLLVQQLLNGKMPKQGQKLSAQQIQLIAQWIDEGAPNN